MSDAEQSRLLRRLSCLEPRSGCSRRVGRARCWMGMQEPSLRFHRRRGHKCGIPWTTQQRGNHLPDIAMLACVSVMHLWMPGTGSERCAAYSAQVPERLAAALTVPAMSSTQSSTPLVSLAPGDPDAARPAEQASQLRGFRAVRLCPAAPAAQRDARARRLIGQPCCHEGPQGPGAAGNQPRPCTPFKNA
jgi:hypothetical protein